MNLHWQIQRDLSRSRVDDIARTARYAHHHAHLHRRPLRRVAAAVRWTTDRIGRALPHRAVPRGGAGGTRVADLGVPQVRPAVAVWPELATAGHDERREFVSFGR